MKLTFILSLGLFLSTFSQTTYHYYYGNLHSHTGFSDGSQDSTTSGISEPSGAYQFAKASQHFDFLGISEHNHYSSAHNPGFKRPLYQKGLDIADSARQDSTFLSLFGIEYGVLSDYNGHVVVYGFDQLLGWESNVGGISGNNYDIYNAKSDYQGLFRKVKNNPNAFCYLAHPNTSDYTVNGVASSAIANGPYRAMYDSAIVGVPLRSGDAFSHSTNYDDFPSGDYTSYYKKLLAIGYHIGIGYDHDNHNTTFGRNDAGRLVILAPALTQPNLISAMQQMHFYGSDDWNAQIEFTKDGNIMGSILTGSTVPTFNVVHNDADGETTNYIQIWKGQAGSGILPTMVYSGSHNSTVTYTDPHPFTHGLEYYYFAVIKQADGDLIVTTPIWYKSTVDIGIYTGIKENSSAITLNYFPNPVSKQLNISVAESGTYTVSIFDISGRLVLKHASADKDLVLDISGIERGAYTLTIATENASVSKKLIVE